MSKRKADRPLPHDEQTQSAGFGGSARRRTATAAVADEQQQQQQQHRSAAGSAPVTASPFRRLATVELQLVMQHCDFKTLLALARCSRFTFAAASNPFAWRSLLPLSFTTNDADLGGHLRGSRLLAHCDVALRWMRPPAVGWRQPDVEAAELAAIESVPRLVQLDIRRWRVGDAQLRRLLSHPALAGLTALHGRAGRLDNSCIALLPLHQPRLRTLTLGISRDSDAGHHVLAPLQLLPSLTDLSLGGATMDESGVEIIGRCASLRRLRLSGLDSAVVVAVLAVPARARLESLSLSAVREPDDIPAHAAHVRSWRASFENLQSLRSLSLQHCDDFNVMLAGLAAALTTGTALRSLTALRAKTLKMDNADGSLIPLLAAHCPQLRQLHLFEDDGLTEIDCATLAGLPLLSSLADLRLQCGSRPSDEVELAVGRCAALTRLHLAAIRPSSLHSILRSSQMQRLESLTLKSVDFDWDDCADGENVPGAGHGLGLDWSICFANLRSLRSLDLDGCDGGDRLLAAVQAACPPLLCSMRCIHRGSRSISGVVPPLQLLPALLAQLPALRVELFEETPPSQLNSHVAVKKADHLTMLCAVWQKLQRRHPARVIITQLDEYNFAPFDSWTD